MPKFDKIFLLQNNPCEFTTRKHKFERLSYTPNLVLNVDL